MITLGEIRWMIACRMINFAVMIAPRGTARTELTKAIIQWGLKCRSEWNRKQDNV